MKISSLLTTAAVLILSHISPVSACTGIKLTAKDGATVSGRTLEFGILIDTSVVVIPRDYEFTGSTTEGSGLKYKAKYAALGTIAFDNMAIMDGINEKGLVVGVFYFPGFAKYTPLTTENQARALSPIDFPNWILTQFATLDEVKEALTNIVIVPTVSQAWGTTPPPFHYIVYDKNGRSLVIEPIEGKLVVHENPLGVFTNSPNFDWHMTNLRNYINLTPFNVKPLTINGFVLAPLGQGSGMVGLPGDFTPPSRFVRATAFSTTATPSDNAQSAVWQAFHILNQFDIPVGVARAEENGIIHTDYTIMTTVKDPQALTYYFRSYVDQNIKMVNLNQFDLNAKTIKKVSTTYGKQSVTDISSTLK